MGTWKEETSSYKGVTGLYTGKKKASIRNTPPRDNTFRLKDYGHQDTVSSGNLGLACQTCPQAVRFCNSSRTRCEPSLSRRSQGQLPEL